MRESPRTRRLRSDQRALENLRAESSIIEYESNASYDRPPEMYVIRFRGKGAWRPEGSSQVAIRDQHEFNVRLGANYPRMMPEISWRSPIFHPNISSSGFVCLGGYGTYWAPSLNLDELCIMLWNMVRYENYDVNSPYNREAALWARSQHEFPLPLDKRPLRDRRANGSIKTATPPVPSDSVKSDSSLAPMTLPPMVRKVEPPPQPDIVYLDDVVVAEVVPARDPELLIIE